MNLMQLQCFCAVAETSNFTQAAQKLFVTQPAISRLISALEKEVGLQLLKRDTRHVSLTPAGEAFFHSSQRMLEDYTDGISGAKLAARGWAGKLRVGFLRDTFDSDLARLILAYRQRYPNVYVEMKGYNHTQITDAILKGAIDVAASSRLDVDAEAIQYTRIRKVQDMAILPRDHALATKESLYLSDLQKCDFILMSRSSSVPGHDFLMKAAKEAGFIPNVVAYAMFVPELLTMVASGLGVSVMSGSLAALAGESCAFVPLKLIGPSWKSVFWRSTNDNPCLVQLIEMIRTLES